MTDGKKLDSRLGYAGRMLRLDVDTVRLPNDATIELEIVRHPGAAAVVPLDADGNVVMVRQYRYTVASWLLEIPAGKLDRAGEDPLVCARRELLEETGYSADSLTPLGAIWVSPGFTDEKISLYLAQGLTAGDQRLEPDEVIEVVRVPYAEAVRQAETGEITDAKSAVALLRAARIISPSG